MMIEEYEFEFRWPLSLQYGLTTAMSELPTEEVTHNSDNVIKKKPLNFRTEMLK